METIKPGEIFTLNGIVLQALADVSEATLLDAQRKAIASEDDEQIVGAVQLLIAYGYAKTVQVVAIYMDYSGNSDFTVSKCQ